MTGPELKKLREHLSEALGRKLTAADMAKLCGLSAAGGAEKLRRWEVTGPTPKVAAVLRVLAMASEHYPILEKFDVFDRHDVPVRDRAARRQAFREQMRDDVCKRLA
ncbi:hypothetical protein J2R76_006448 [Bradyrhizobium sp. USDA 4532]|uniref:hypothetical protein n=1 Tax=unclassified Bradyrhizobium TaxID=2631580 RepID=UPI00209F1E4B|nr:MULTISPECIES: hypothetical protein [unclassified Bradyrhizobium]MCP1829748.1 hypothetical protein [Bradyrhizobium sp. USDA 4545]MCP1922857.1 hypothetical protein [Bradyrhizobium sp. USDA 4532]